MERFTDIAPSMAENFKQYKRPSPNNHFALQAVNGPYMWSRQWSSVVQRISQGTPPLIPTLSVPHTELDVFSPGFIEVDNDSGLSNFIPILIADEEVCKEIKIMQMKYYSKDIVFRESKFSELLVDMAWLLKQPVVEEDMECVAMSSQLQRFTCVVYFLIEYESTTVLKRVLECVKMRFMKNEGDGTLFEGIVNHAVEVVHQRLEKKVNQYVLPFISTVNQDMVVADSRPIPKLGDKSETVALLNAEYIMSVTPGKEQSELSDLKKTLNVELDQLRSVRTFSIPFT
ncbi:hypothetical protein L2E82_09941 [Cichorium intybus]|uniref:Uncharacterized protein n=1 Tax=Cichorium intybus TaxID=13427 RepID=A0ACB9G9D8_CICIN|nr:hypothetical protein L2E82_09941 [Cichorium intybus]